MGASEIDIDITKKGHHKINIDCTGTSEKTYGSGT